MRLKNLKEIATSTNVDTFSLMQNGRGRLGFVMRLRRVDMGFVKIGGN